MNMFDVLYTPLDVPAKPKIDINKLESWLKLNYVNQSKFKDILMNAGFHSESSIPNYPWDFTVAYFNAVDSGPGWLGGFDSLFPELSTYMYESLGLPLNEIGLISFLSTRPNQSGLNFWHNDRDITGIRMYIEYENSDQNKLLLRKTKIAHDRHIPLTIPVDENLLQEQVLECKFLSNTQTCFINNNRAAHASYTGVPGSKRIVAFITSKLGRQPIVADMLNDLVVRSAEKYREHALFY